MDTKELLKRLISYPTVSSESNLELIAYVRDLLKNHGIDSQLVFNASETKAALFASVGPASRPGILLSGHTDVVPVKGQTWDSDPFMAIEQDQRIYGRGSCDMKGFIACAIHVLLEYAAQPLKRPVHLALSYDEELGCLGVKDLLMQLQQLQCEPYLCIVGEPTSMDIATGHKGKTSYRAHCHGDAAHSSLAPLHTNAVYLACDMIAKLRALQNHLMEKGARDPNYDVPFSTVHVGTIDGGSALNIVPQDCQFEFEIRHLPGDDIQGYLQSWFEQARALIAAARKAHPDTAASVSFECLTDYPGLDTPADHRSVQQLASLSSSSKRLVKVAFGSEGGLFAEYLSAPVVVCGPGSIAQAHQPNEFVALDQLEQCGALLNQLVRSSCL
ncbi:MAG: Acetylornithine deacetylase [Candidatus Celerinatantimonas neptuna]|nr:MAG: Acetylornithine deacetylase [Candidatus Celerinatantimonas neptuna]